MTARPLPLLSSLPLPAVPRWSHLVAGLRRLAARRQARRHQRLGHDQLRAMGELELKDLGIGRCEVDYCLGRGPIPHRRVA